MGTKKFHEIFISMLHNRYMRLLIIEDNRILAENIRTILAKYHVVDVVHNGNDALEYIDEHSYDLLILDLHLPDVFGSDLCSSVRDRGLEMPILIVTADQSPSGVVDLLDAGADDYICKPFRAAEFKARVKALLRRQQLRVPVPQQLQAGKMILDVENHSVNYDHKSIPLRSKEFLILEQLMLHPNIALSRASLLSKVWDENDEPWPTVIDAHIKNLRRKIAPDVIETVHGYGYRVNDK